MSSKIEATRLEFNRLRDHREPGADAPKYTEAQAFELAVQALLAPGTATLQQAPQEDGIGECWSADEEDFNCRTLGELIDQNDHLVAGVTVWRGDAVAPPLSHLCDADDVIDTMADRAQDIAGEHAGVYPDVNDAAKDELNALLAAWVDKHCPPSFYTVENMVPYTLTADDIPAGAEIEPAGAAA